MGQAHPSTMPDREVPPVSIEEEIVSLRTIEKSFTNNPFRICKDFE
jgi:hypothetical protein